MKDSEFVGGKLKIKGLKIKKKGSKKKKEGRVKEKEGERENERKKYGDRGSEIRGTEWDSKDSEKKNRNINDKFADDNEKEKNINKNSESNDIEQMVDFKEIESEKLKDILNSNLTDAEKVNRLILQKREKQRIEKILKESYRRRLQKFNDNLASLSEHFDIPKVGPG